MPTGLDQWTVAIMRAVKKLRADPELASIKHCPLMIKGLIPIWVGLGYSGPASNDNAPRP